MSAWAASRLFPASRRPDSRSGLRPPFLGPFFPRHDDLFDDEDDARRGRDGDERSGQAEQRRAGEGRDEHDGTRDLHGLAHHRGVMMYASSCM